MSFLIGVAIVVIAATSIVRSTVGKPALRGWWDLALAGLFAAGAVVVDGDGWRVFYAGYSVWLAFDAGRQIARREAALPSRMP